MEGLSTMAVHTYRRHEIAGLAGRLYDRGTSSSYEADHPGIKSDLIVAATLLRKWLANDPFESVEVEY
jgi:hypothetical protein